MSNHNFMCDVLMNEEERHAMNDHNRMDQMEKVKVTKKNWDDMLIRQKVHLHTVPLFSGVCLSVFRKEGHLRPLDHCRYSTDTNTN